MRGLIVGLLLLPWMLYGFDKTPSDVFSQAKVLERILIELRKEQHITAPLKELEIQRGKLPRHVLQKSLEVLNKVNRYRELHRYGKIAIPPVPSRHITPQDVYKNVNRLKQEVSYFLKNRQILKQERFKAKPYSGKTPSDVYRLLWRISLGFDDLIGRGFTPTDVYIQTQQIIKQIKFIRSSQRRQTHVKMPKRKMGLHPNHALYKAVALIKKISKVEKKLWIKPVPVPKVAQKIISPTEVYDALQTVTAELSRISRRLGIERSFEKEEVKEEKTPSDVVQNLEYAIALLPEFSFEKKLNQYPINSLVKTPNEVYALSEYILNKIKYIKEQRGIHRRARKAHYIYGLKPIHVYVKGLENLEKVAKLKRLEGFKPSQIPAPPNTKITPSEVYELILRLDDELTLIYNDNPFLDESLHLVAYRNYMNKKEYHDKVPSDVFNKLWQVSYELDTILNQAYTPNETYVLAKRIERDVDLITKHFLGRNYKLKLKKSDSKRPADVYKEAQILMDKIQRLKERGNMNSVKIAIPKESNITPTTVYNALRIISATLSEVRVFHKISKEFIEEDAVQNKSPSDVYGVVERLNRKVTLLLRDQSYEN